MYECIARLVLQENFISIKCVRLKETDDKFLIYTKNDPSELGNGKCIGVVRENEITYFFMELDAKIPAQGKKRDAYEDALEIFLASYE